MFFLNKLYKEDLETIASCDIAWEKIKNKNILITGATGLIGSFLIDLLMFRNTNFNDNITIYAVSRSYEKIFARFKEYINSKYFVFIQNDIKKPLEIDIQVDYIIHGASNTHPIAYSTEPINTILTSILGTNYILDFASTHNVKRTLFLSTVEIYGENRGDVDEFNEDYCGYINCNTLRAGYPESKRAAETLCQAYIKERNIDIVNARCCRVYGPTMGDDDSKVIAQFIRNAVKNEDIVLKSKGEQRYSYCYVADICAALLVLLINGENGEAYNISDYTNSISLSEIANIISEFTGKSVVFELPSSIESEGYSKATKALLDSSKLRELGWKSKYSIKEGIIRTIRILKIR